MTPSKFRYLVDSEFLKVIKVNDRTGNLALTTYVTVNTTTNECELKYSVRSWNDHESHRFISKEFTSYMDAYNYYKVIHAEYKQGD